jgi:hypothetical protein
MITRSTFNLLAALDDDGNINIKDSIPHDRQSYPKSSKPISAQIYDAFAMFGPSLPVVFDRLSRGP